MTTELSFMTCGRVNRDPQVQEPSQSCKDIKVGCLKWLPVPMRSSSEAGEQEDQLAQSQTDVQWGRWFGQAVGYRTEDMCFDQFVDGKRVGLCLATSSVRNVCCGQAVCGWWGRSRGHAV